MRVDDDPFLAIEEVARLRGRLRRTDLVAAGLADREIAGALRAGRLVRVRRDAYRVAEPGDRHADLRLLARAALEDGAILGGPAALLVHDLPLFGRPTTVHVCATSRGGRGARAVRARIARPPDSQLAEHEGRLVSGVARAVLDTARLDGLVAGVVAADAALRRGATTPAELAGVAATMAGLAGVVRARLCCDLADARSESPGESWSAVVLHRHGLPRPERQEVFRDARGFVARADFWWPGRRVVGEFDGRVKYGRANPTGRPPEDVLWAEKLREDRLRALGPVVARWTTADLRAPGPWIARLRGLLA